MGEMMRYLIVTLLFISGCLPLSSTPTVTYPIIQTPMRPQLHVISQEQLQSLDDNTIRQLIENDNRLKNYIEKLEAAINTYNEWARNR